MMQAKLPLPALSILALFGASLQYVRAKETFRWEMNQLGLERTVPAPWTPIKTHGLTVDVWGRSIAFGTGALPEQITSQGVPLLDGPMRLSLQVNGREQSDRAAGTAFSERADDQVVLAGALRGEGADLAIRTQLDFDGLLRFSLTLSARAGKAVVDHMIVDIPVRREVGEYFSHYLYYDFDLQEIDRTALINSAGRIDRPIARAFNPHFWVGNRRIGFELGMETDLFWSPADPQRAIELIPEGDIVMVRLNVVTRPVAITQPMVVEFSLLPNPFKPQVKDFRARIVSNQKKVSDAWDRALWTFNTMRVGPDFFIPLEYDSLSIPPRAPARRAEYDHVRVELKRNGIRYIPYSALHSIDVRIPEVDKYRREWIRDPSPDRVKPDRGAREAISLYPRSVQDFYVWNFVELIRTENEDGLYFDWASTGKPVVNPLAARWHVTDKSKTYTPVFSVADFHRRLYRAVHAAKPDYLITQHHSKMPALFSIYSDMIYSGEAMNPLFKETGSKMMKRGELPEGCPPYWPDYSLFPDDFWMATYHQGLGTSHMFLSNISKRFNREWIAKHPEHYRRFTRCLLARTLVLDTPVVNGGMHAPTLSTLLLGFQNRFGGLTDPIRYTGPDQAEIVRLNEPRGSRLKLAAYVKPDGRTVLICANWTKEAVTESVTINFGGLRAGLARLKKITDLEGGSAPRFSADAIEASVPPNDYRVWLIE